MKDFSFIPGIIERIEQSILQNTCSKIDLSNYPQIKQSVINEFQE